MPHASVEIDRKRLRHEARGVVGLECHGFFEAFDRQGVAALGRIGRGEDVVEADGGRVEGQALAGDGRGLVKVGRLEVGARLLEVLGGRWRRNRRRQGCGVRGAGGQEAQER